MVGKTKEDKESLRKLQQEMMRLAVVMHNSSESIIIQDMDGKITTWNRGAEKMYGYSAGEMLGMNIEMITPPGKLAEQKEYFRLLLAGEAVESFETSRVAKDGSIFDVWLTVTKMLEEPTDSIISQGQELSNPIGLAMLERNITARKQAEAALQKAHDELEQKVQERTLQLKERTEQLQAKITEQELAETQLKVSEERYRLLTENAIDLIFILNKDMRHSFMSSSVTPLLGYSVEEIMALPPERIFTPATFALLKEDVAKEMDIAEGATNSSSSTRPNEVELIRKDGSILWVEVRLTTLRDLEGHFTGVHGIARDITERKRSETELRSSEERFSKAFNASPSPMSIATFPDGRYVEVNEAFLKVFGYRRDEVIGLTKSELNVFEEPEDLVRATQFFIEHGSLRDWETAERTKSGEPLICLLSVDSIEIGGTKYVLSVTNDITERKRMEKMLQESEEKYRTVFENTGTMMAVIEEDMTMSLVNTEAEKLTGYSREEVEGKKKWTDFVAPDDLEKMAEYHHLRRADATGVPTVYEFKSINKQGAVRNSSMVVSMIPGTKKSIAALLDITERKKVEMNLQEAHQKLISLVKELEDWNREMAQLSEMGEMLQSCQSLEEVYSVGAQFSQRIFLGTQGALYLVNPSRELVEAVSSWGESLCSESTFMPADCWALRRGRLYPVTEPSGLLCRHITKPQAAHYLCVPLISLNEVLGLLHLQYELQENAAESFFNEHKQWVAQEMADHIALALSNLKLRETLRQQSIRDMLTGLFNRSYMDETLARELHRAEREKKTVGVIMFDIDHFKDFNDLFGHDGGDALLRELGGFLIKRTRGGDIVSRYGGEEFVSVLPGATLEDTRIRAEELRQGVKELQVYSSLGQPLSKCTISFGVAAFPEHGLAGDEILKRADTALYRAKNEGRDRVVVASIN